MKIGKIVEVREWIGGYKARYIDRIGNSCPVNRTFCFGPALSWHDKKGNWMVVSGHDQGRLVDTSETMTQKPA